MDYAMDFKAIWPLLRKEKWTWKAATGIQIQDEHLCMLWGLAFTNSFTFGIHLATTTSNLVENLEGGKQGEYFFNGEDELLAYVRSDKALCARLKIPNVVRSNQNANADGKSVEPPPTTPASTASPPPRAEPSDADETGDADVEGISSSGNTDAGALARANADTDRPALADNADQDAGVQATTGVNSTALVTNADTGESAAATAGTGCSLAETHANVDISPADSESSVAFRSADVDSTRVSNGDDEHYSSDESVEEVTADSQDEACKPDDDEDQEGDHDVNDASDEATKVADSRPACVESSKRVLRYQGGSSPLRFDYADILDPNFVEPDGENSLDTDGEGDDDPAEAAASE
ncbi:hypothetical protein PR002_g13849, partial [Phytophthora rubi]